MARLGDTETKGSEPIIWIDDPISSLDSNHIFFIYSLIHTEIVTHSENGERFKHLFISTHNLDFLKYLKRLCEPRDEDKHMQYFILSQTHHKSHLALMPNYLKKYVTEFNYLFHQIYKCATIEEVDDENYQIICNFGNTMRKFLEIYLYYRYPTHAKKEIEKYENCFGHYVCD